MAPTPNAPPTQSAPAQPTTPPAASATSNTPNAPQPPRLNQQEIIERLVSGNIDAVIGNVRSAVSTVIVGDDFKAKIQGNPNVVSYGMLFDLVGSNRMLAPSVTTRESLRLALTTVANNIEPVKRDAFLQELSAIQPVAAAQQPQQASAAHAADAHPAHAAHAHLDHDHAPAWYKGGKWWKAFKAGKRMPPHENEDQKYTFIKFLQWLEERVNIRSKKYLLRRNKKT